MKLVLTLLTAAVLLISIVACSDSFKPSEANVAGNYSLLTLTTTDTSGNTDWVAAGATLTISLQTNGTTVGNLFIPGAGPGGSDFAGDMAGTWALGGAIVTFDQTADTFVRDMPFTAGKNRLSGDETYGPTRVRIVLTK